MLVENAYPNDTRVRNEAETLSAAGYKVTVVGVRRKSQCAQEVVDGVQVYRIPNLELFKKTPIRNPTRWQQMIARAQYVIGYMAEYVYFTAACLLMSLYVGWKHGFDVIHVHNPPDTLWVVALPWKVLGRKRFIFDHHDVSPELYRSRYAVSYGLMARALKAIEWVNLKFADVTIATNESYKDIAIARGGRSAETVFVVRNGPSAERMQSSPPRWSLRESGKKILVYVGSLNPQDGVDYLLRSLRYLKHDHRRDDFTCIIIGSGDSFDDLRKLARELHLDGTVQFRGYVSDQELQETLAAADICMDPDPASPLNNVSTWIKIMEYMAYSKPIVSFDLKETRYSAAEAAVYVPPNDERAFAEATARLMDDPPLRERMGHFARERVEQQLQWSVVGKNLLAAYASLSLGRRRDA
jgi:glycosyltransferase involved in cell wall biosynthesis